VTLRLKINARTFLIVALIVTVAFSGFIFIHKLIDFPVYYAAGRSLLGGRVDLYSPDFALGPVMDYRYPPFFLFIFTPLWLLPYKVAAYVWYLLSVMQIAGCVWVLRRLTAPRKSSLLIWLISALATAQYFIMILHYGNAHLLAVSLMFAAFYWNAKQKDQAAALAMALSITIKLTPILVLPYFAVKKKWRLLGLVAVWIVVLNLLPVTYFGWTKNAQLLGTWYQHVVASQEFHEANGPVNLSLKGQMRRYFTEVDYAQRVDGDVRYPAVNVASFPSEPVAQVALGLAALIFLGALALIWRVSGKATNPQTEPSIVAPGARDQACAPNRLALELALMICLMLLIEPLTSKIYFIVLLWPVYILAEFAFACEWPSARFARRVVVAVAVINSVLPLLPGRSVQRWLLVAGVDFAVNALLLAALIWVLIASARAFQPRCAAPQMPAL
jgi:hypothetical protein